MSNRVAKMLREARTAWAMSLARASRETGLSESTMGALERGACPVPDDHLDRIAMAYGLCPIILHDVREQDRNDASACDRPRQ
jgi:DNA-binding XRE family transcriptional regulator